MKKVKLIAMAMLLFAGTALQAQKTEKKMLIVYYSWSNSGNTRHMAGQIQKLTGADIHEIKPATAYPRDYNAVVDQAKKEINANYRPPLKTKVENIGEYDIEKWLKKIEIIK